MHELEELELFGKTDNPSLLDLVQPGTLAIVDLSDIIFQRKKQIIVAYLAHRIFYSRREKKIPPRPSNSPDRSKISSVSPDGK